MIHCSTLVAPKKCWAMCHRALKLVLYFQLVPQRCYSNCSQGTTLLILGYQCFLESVMLMVIKIGNFKLWSSGLKVILFWVEQNHRSFRLICVLDMLVCSLPDSSLVVAGDLGTTCHALPHLLVTPKGDDRLDESGFLPCTLNRRLWSFVQAKPMPFIVTLIALRPLNNWESNCFRFRQIFVEARRVSDFRSPMKK